MDQNRFDILTRSLATTGSRRRALAAALSCALGLLGRGGAEAKKKKLCPPCKKRKKGKCKPQPNGTACGGGTCRGGRCVATAGPPPPPSPPAPPAPPFTCEEKTDGTPCDGGKQCSGGVCDTPPNCQNGTGCRFPADCCSGQCQCPELDGSCLFPGTCLHSADGRPCNGDGDCGTFSNCVGFVCQAL
jgi:hypothetical protein